MKTQRTPPAPPVCPDPLDRVIERALADPTITPRLRRWLERLASSNERAESTPQAEREISVAK